MGKKIAHSIPFWFRQRYHLPPNDPRFLALTPEEVETEFWACQYAEKPATEDYEDDSIDIEEILAQADREEAALRAAKSDEWEEVINDG
jgi:hypothetical protein